jgi:CRP-like cAMP-binding protein
MAIVEALRCAELFRDLSHHTLQVIAGFSSPQSIEAGDTVYQLGDDADYLYLLDSGRVRFSLGVGNRPNQSGSIITPGDVFGWTALLRDQPRRVATAACLEDTAVYVIPGIKMLEHFETNSEAGYLTMRRLATIAARNFMSALSV